MTQERLRELLRERVADETMPDYSGRAWQAARVVRRRRRLGAAAGVVVATVGIAGGIAVLDSAPPAPPVDQGVSDASTSPTAESEAESEAGDATYKGVPIWWSPDQDEEQLLPAVDSPLPAEIDLDDATSYQPGELDRAVAAFARGRQVIVVGPKGQLRTVDVSQLQEVTKPNGYSYFPTSTAMLASNGEWLVFRQPGPDDAGFNIATGEWISAPYSDDADAGPLDLTFDASAAQRYGENRDGAQSFGMGVNLPVRDPSVDLSGPEFLVARGAVLAIMDRFADEGSRYKDCCPVAGWLDDETVVYESRQSEPLLVAWRLGSHDFGLVSRIRGAYDVASFALG